ncbi:MAG TPA: protein kinase [Thermoanaerobaculia bacterium]|jgi:Tol biopolymer transport system component
MEPGTRLGPYEIVEPLGAGGMGEVYRARDTRLDRSVAAKVLPRALSHDPQFRARFEREAKTISRLNHPNICQIYDVGDGTSEVAFLIMELLEGETLADRLSRGALPLADVLRYGKQIADALAAAHRAGIVHRDLKPGNVMLTKSGAKLLDFGLAKQAAGFAASDPNAPTVAHEENEKPLTREGTIVGTFQYMAPEQLEGLEADARTDIFAFGNVLYEMLTGRRAFEGKTRTSLIAAIVDREPAPISTLQPLTPPSLEHVVLKCLEKDPNARWQSARDVGSELEWIERSGTSTSRAAAARPKPSWRQWALVALAALALASLAAGIAWSVAARRPEPPRLTAAIPPPTPAGFGLRSEGAASLTISPDGRWLTFLVPEGTDGRSRLWVRSLGSGANRPLPGTEGAKYPFWSPDSRKVAFFAGGKLKTIPLAGGPPSEICDVQEPRGGAWSSDGVIVMTPHWRESLWKVAASGGTPERITRLREDKQETTHRWPVFLPDGRHFVYLAGTHLDSAGANNALYVGSVDGGEPRLLATARSNAVYAAGHLLYLRDRYLVAHRFDPGSLSLEGEPVAVAEDVRYESGFFRGVFAATDDLLVFQRGGPGMSSVLQWYDRTGKKTGTLGQPGDHFALTISRDGKLVASTEGDPSNIWVHDLRRGLKSRATFQPFNDEAVAWSADGTTIFYNSDRNVHWDLFRKKIGGTAEEQLLVRPRGHDYTTDVAADGTLLLYERGDEKATVAGDIYLLRLDGSRTTTPYLASQFSERGARFSPDQRWVSYSSNESGRHEVYIASFPDPAVRHQVSLGGGIGARWRRDGRELFYRRPDGTIMAVDVTLQPEVSIGDPRPLVRTNMYVIDEDAFYDVTADGQRFLVNDLVGEPDRQPLTLITRWSERRQ